MRGGSHGTPLFDRRHQAGKKVHSNKKSKLTIMKLKTSLTVMNFQFSGRVPFFLTMLLFNFTISIFTSLLGSLYLPDSFNTGIFEGWPLAGVFFVSVIAGPFIETLLYQYALIEGTLYYTGKNRSGIVLAIVISALVFGISHLYNLVYMAAALCMGLSLAFTYIRFKGRGDISPLMGVYTIHAGINLMAFIVNDFPW